MLWMIGVYSTHCFKANFNNQNPQTTSSLLKGDHRYICWTVHSKGIVDWFIWMLHHLAKNTQGPKIHKTSHLKYRTFFNQSNLLVCYHGAREYKFQVINITQIHGEVCLSLCRDVLKSRDSILKVWLCKWNLISFLLWLVHTITENVHFHAADEFNIYTASLQAIPRFGPSNGGGGTPASRCICIVSQQHRIWNRNSPWMGC